MVFKEQPRKSSKSTSKARRLEDPAALELLVRLRTSRLAVGLSQGELAKRVGKKQSWISKIEKGRRSLQVVDYVRLCVALGIDPAQLITQVARSIKG